MHTFNVWISPKNKWSRCNNFHWLLFRFLGDCSTHCNYSSQSSIDADYKCFLWFLIYYFFVIINRFFKIIVDFFNFCFFHDSLFYEINKNILHTDWFLQSSNFRCVVLDGTTYYFTAFALDSNDNILDTVTSSVTTDFGWHVTPNTLCYRPLENDSSELAGKFNFTMTEYGVSYTTVA